MNNTLVRRKIYGHSAMMLSALCFVFLAVLFFLSIFRTAVYLEDAYLGEYVISELDSGFFNIILLTVMVCASYLVYRVCEHLDLKLLTILMCLWTVFLGCLFVYSASRAPEGDAEIIANTAFLAANGNYTAMADYFQHYPFSIGLAFYEELVFRFLQIGIPDISRGYCIMALQIVNVLLLCVAFLAFMKMGGLLFKSKDVEKLIALLFMLFVPALISCTAINGRIPALSFGALAMLCFVYYMETRRGLFVPAAAICLSISLAMKLDALVVLTAIIFIWLMRSFRERSGGIFAALAVFLLITVMLSFLPALTYVIRAEDISELEVASMRNALGFDETEQGSLIYSGMYSASSTEISQFHSSADSQEKNGMAKAFFHQWNDPEFDSIRSNKISRNYRETGEFYRMVCESEQRLLPVFLNLYQSFLLAGAAIAMIGLIKDRELLKLMPAAVLLGGVILHIFFPTDSSYTMKYYILLLPLTAYGYCSFFEHFWAKPD